MPTVSDSPWVTAEVAVTRQAAKNPVLVDTARARRWPPLRSLRWCRYFGLGTVRTHRWSRTQSLPPHWGPELSAGTTTTDEGEPDDFRISALGTVLTRMGISSFAKCSYGGTGVGRRGADQKPPMFK
jgi:hypothetical protein